MPIHGSRPPPAYQCALAKHSPALQSGCASGDTGLHLLALCRLIVRLAQDSGPAALHRGC